MVAHVLGFAVPETTVIARMLPPFTFGERTGTSERWLRTCPREQVPGKFTTVFGWQDPFLLLAHEDPEGTVLASVLAQEGIEPVYSGAAISTADGDVVIEGVYGRGDAFMVGTRAPAVLPTQVVRAVRELYDHVVQQLGPVRFEWVYDGSRVWLVQLHSGRSASTSTVIYPGSPTSYQQFEVEKGIEALRQLIADIAGTDQGVILVGDVGITSHMGDLLRKARLPARLQAK